MGNIIYDVAVIPRVVLDTNVIITGLQSSTGASRLLLSMLEDRTFQMCYSNALLYEYEEVIHRQRERIGLDTEEIEDFLGFLIGVGRAQFLHIHLRPQLSDPKDEHVLELAFNAACSHIVTFNLRDLTPARAFGIEVVRPSEFLQHLGAAL